MSFRKEYYSFDVLREFEESEGANNEGILLVRDNARQRLLIEKRFKLFDLWNGHAQNEVEVLRQLRGHANITSIEGYLLQDGSVEDTRGSVWMEYCNQGTLASSIDSHDIQNRWFDELEVWHVFAQLAEAVRFCQQGPVVDASSSTLVDWNPIYHLDISPHNVFMTVDGEGEGLRPRILLGDFGCSVTHFSQLEKAAMLVEDPSVEVDQPFVCAWQNADFAAPEAPYFSLKSDVYQLGLVIYCMLARETCMMGVDLGAGLREADKYSSELREVVSACLQRDPDHRPNITQLKERVDLEWWLRAGDDGTGRVVE